MDHEMNCVYFSINNIIITQSLPIIRYYDGTEVLYISVGEINFQQGETERLIASQHLLVSLRSGREIPQSSTGVGDNGQRGRSQLRQ